MVICLNIVSLFIYDETNGMKWNDCFYCEQKGLKCQYRIMNRYDLYICLYRKYLIVFIVIVFYGEVRRRFLLDKAGSARYYTF